MKFLKKTKFILFFILLCAFFFISFLLVDRLFLIKKIELVSSMNFSLVNRDEILNKSLLFINKEKIADRIIKDNFNVKTAKVEKVLPDRLKVEVSFYEPCASLIVSKGFFNLSCDGRILQKINKLQANLPLVNYYQKLNNGSFSTGDWINFNDLKNSLLIAEKLKQINLIILTIDIKGQDMLVFNLIDNKQIVFSNNKDKNVQEYQLELIIKQFKIEGKTFKKIDLRFEKPIIQF